MTLRHSRGRRPAHRTRTPEVVHPIPAAAQHVPVEAHQEAHLIGRALPVLGRERIRGQIPDAEFDAALDDVEQRSLAALVAGGARQPTAGRPPTVAVHDECDVPRHQLGRDVGRPGARRMRVGCGRASAGHRSGATGAGRPSAVGSSSPGVGPLEDGDRRRRPFDQRQRPKPPLEVPLQQRRDQPGRLPPVHRLDRVGGRPVPVDERCQQGDRRRRRAHHGTGPAVRAEHAAGGDVERAVRAGLTAAGALGQRRRPAGQDPSRGAGTRPSPAKGRGRSRSSARSAETSSRYSRRLGSRSSAVNRSVVSTITVARGVAPVVGGQRRTERVQ